MEFDFAHLVSNSVIIEQSDWAYYASSRHESGLDNIAEITWQRCEAFSLQESDQEWPDDEVIRDHFKEYGAWDDLDSWDTNSLRALLWQEIATASQSDEDSRVYGTTIYLGV